MHELSLACALLHEADRFWVAHGASRALAVLDLTLETTETVDD
jgi:hypothetical protein